MGSIVLSEILYSPAQPGTQFVEVMNRSTDNFDLAGWRLDGASGVFPTGSIVTNGQIIVLARNRAAFRRAYGKLPVLGTLDSALPTQDGTLVLLATNAGGDVFVDGVHYESGAPFPSRTVS